MFHVLILMSILVLNCEVLWANLAGLGAMLYKIKSYILLLLLSKHSDTVTVRVISKTTHLPNLQHFTTRGKCAPSAPVLLMTMIFPYIVYTLT